MSTYDGQVRLRAVNWLLHGAGLLSIGLTVAAVYVGIDRTCVQPRSKQDTEAARLVTVLETAGEVLQQHRKLTDELAQLERNALLMRERIPDQPREAEFLRQVTAAAEAVKLRIVNYERQGVIATETHSEFDVRLNCQGSHAAICEFLDRLERLSRVAVVKNVSIVARDNIGSYPMDLTLTLYYRTGSAPAQG